MESILTSIKKMLSGIPEDVTAFDTDIIILINSAFAVLNQVLSGQGSTFSISDKSALWSDFITDDRLNFVKSYVYMKVKVIFDPPATAAFLEAMNKEIKELEYRLSIADAIEPLPVTIETIEEV